MEIEVAGRSVSPVPVRSSSHDSALSNGSSGSSGTGAGRNNRQSPQRQPDEANQQRSRSALEFEREAAAWDAEYDNAQNDEAHHENDGDDEGEDEGVLDLYLDDDDLEHSAEYNDYADEAEATHPQHNNHNNNHNHNHPQRRRSSMVESPLLMDSFLGTSASEEGEKVDKSETENSVADKAHGNHNANTNSQDTGPTDRNSATTSNTNYTASRRLTMPEYDIDESDLVPLPSSSSASSVSPSQPPGRTNAAMSRCSRAC